MINKNNMLSLEEVFPLVKEIRSTTKEESISLAKKVAAALKKERNKLVEEQREINISSGFFSTST